MDPLARLGGAGMMAANCEYKVGVYVVLCHVAGVSVVELMEMLSPLVVGLVRVLSCPVLE